MSRSRLVFFKNGKAIGEGRWDGRGNERTASEEVNWGYRHVDFDTAVCKTVGGKVLTVRKETGYGREMGAVGKRLDQGSV